MTILEVKADHTASGKPAATRSGRRLRRTLRVVGWTLIWSGVLLVAFLAYQLWGTGVYTSAAQQQLKTQIEERIVEAKTAPAAPASGDSAPLISPAAGSRPTPPVVVEEAPPPGGEAIGRILIPAAEVDAIIVEGVGREDLKRGPGHMPGTPLPGQPGNAVVSGHRTTYGAPFFYLDQVLVGDKIHVDTLIGRHTYQVREILVVDPTDVWVTEPRPGAWLTLTTCTPRYSAAQRLVIVAELVDGPNLDAVAAVADVTETPPAA